MSELKTYIVEAEYHGTAILEEVSAPDAFKAKEYFEENSPEGVKIIRVSLE